MRTAFDHDDSSATSATSPTVAAEDTPLLRSESSSVTARDASPTPSDHGPAEQSPLGWRRATCIVLSMLVLIFLQGASILLSVLKSRALTD